MSGTEGRSGHLSKGDVRQRVQDIIDRRMSGDLQGMARYFFEDVELNYNCSKLGDFPAVRWRGREALIQNARHTDVNVEALDYELAPILVDGDRCAVRWSSNWRHRATGRYFKMDMAHFLRWQNGLIVEMDEFIDYYAVARAAGPIEQSFDQMISPRDPGVTRQEIADHLSHIGNFSSGPDIALFRRLCSPDVVCEFAGDRNKIFYAGRHRGIEALISIIHSIDVDFEQLGHSAPDVVVIDGAQAATRRTVVWRHRGTGRRGLVELADFFCYEDGKIIEFVEFRDSLALLQMQD